MWTTSIIPSINLGFQGEPVKYHNLHKEPKHRKPFQCVKPVVPLAPLLHNINRLKIFQRSDWNLDNKELTARVLAKSQPQRRCIERCTYWKRGEGDGGGEAAGWGRGRKIEINGCGCGCVGNQQASRQVSDPGEQQKQGLAMGVSASVTERLQQRY